MRREKLKDNKVQKYLKIYEVAKDEFITNNTSRYPQQAHEFALKVMELEVQRPGVSLQKPKPVD